MRDPQQKRRVRRRIAGALGLSVLMGTLLYARKQIPDVETLVELLHTLGGVSPLIYIAVYAVTTILLIPLSVMIFSAGLILGWLGVPVLLGGTAIGCGISFVLGRGFFREPVQELIQGRPRMRGLEKALETDAFRLTLLSRMSPVMPFALYNYAAGAAPMTLPAFLLSTVLGLLPRVCMGVLVGSGGRAVLEAGSLDAIGFEQYAAYGFGIVTTLGVTVVFARLSRRALAIAEAEVEGRTGSNDDGGEAAGREP